MSDDWVAELRRDCRRKRVRAALLKDAAFELFVILLGVIIIMLFA